MEVAPQAVDKRSLSTLLRLERQTFLIQPEIFLRQSVFVLFKKIL